MKNIELSLENVLELNTEELQSISGGEYNPGVWMLFGPAGWALYSLGYLAGKY